MLDDHQIQQIREGFERGYSLIAGDTITHVNGATGKQTTLLAIAYDQGSKEGLSIDNGGLLNKEVREVIFLSTYLEANGVTLAETDWFLVAGERWDFLEDAPIQRAVVPIAGIHSLIIVTLRRAVEPIQTSTQTGTYTYG